MMPSIPSPELPFFPTLDVFPELDEDFDDYFDIIEDDELDDDESFEDE